MIDYGQSPLTGRNGRSQWGYRYHDTETCLAQDATIQQKYGGHLEVLRVNHYGSNHSPNQALLDALSPSVSIFSVGDNNTFGKSIRRSWIGCW